MYSPQFPSGNIETQRSVTHSEAPTPVLLFNFPFCLSFSQYVLTTIGAIFEKQPAECIASFMSHFIGFSEPLAGMFTLLLLRQWFQLQGLSAKPKVT